MVMTNEQKGCTHWTAPGNGFATAGPTMCPWCEIERLQPFEKAAMYTQGGGALARLAAEIEQLQEENAGLKGEALVLKTARERLQNELRRANAALVRHGVENIVVDPGSSVEPSTNATPGATLTGEDSVRQPAESLRPRGLHTTEDDFRHFLSYEKLSGQPAPELQRLQLAYYAAADVPLPVKSTAPQSSPAGMGRADGLDLTD